MPQIELKKNKVIIFTDGGARGNPGPSGIGVVLYEALDETGDDLKLVLEIKNYIGDATNNFAEYTALITALESALSLGYREAGCFLDSELVVKQLKGEYKVKEPTLKLLFEKANKLRDQFSRISFTHVMREKNKEADKLVNAAIDEAIKK